MKRKKQDKKGNKIFKEFVEVKNYISLGNKELKGDF